MKSDLRKYLPPVEADIGAIEQAIADGRDAGAQDGFGRLMNGVNAANDLERWRTGAGTPSTLRELVETLARARGVDESDIRRTGAVDSALWRRVLAAKAEPYRVSARTYARFARRFEIGFASIKQAIAGTYRIFLQQTPGTHASFARSNFRSRSQKDYPQQLAAAFTELRTKSAARRRASADDERIHQFFGEIEEWMS